MGQISLLQRTIASYTAIGILLYLLMLIFKNQYFEYLNLLNTFVFIVSAMILMFFAFQNRNSFPTYLLFVIVFLYSLFFTYSYLSIVEGYTGYPYSLNSPDSYTYLKHSNVLRTLSFSDGIKYLKTTRIADASDWGGVLLPTLVFKIDKSLKFYTFVIICFGTVNAYLVYSIGTHFMRHNYAFIAALAFALSSYNIYFYSCFLKETMFIFFVLLSVHFFFKYLENFNVVYLALAIIFSLFIYFFRPIVIAILWMSYLSYYVTSESRDYRTWFMILVFLVFFMAVFTDIESQANRYTNDGNLATIDNYKDTSVFGVLASVAGVFLGPFPTFTQLDSNLHFISVMGAGTLLKFILFFTHWKGLFYAIRMRNPMMLSLFAFSIIEMVAISIVNDGLELRKAYPHYPTFILCAFWFMDEYDKDVDKSIVSSPYYRKTSKQFIISCIIVFVASLVWNTMRSKSSSTKSDYLTVNDDTKQTEYVHRFKC